MVNPLRYFYHNILPMEWKAKVKQIRYPEINPNNAYLPIFLESETIFVHIPKTAGTSVSQALYGEQPYHHSIKQYYKLDPEKCERFFKFGFVRNPWARLASSFSYARKISDPVYRGSLSDVAACKSFEDFVMNWCQPERVKHHHFMKPQFDFLSLDGRQIDVDFVGRFESLEQDFNEIAKRMGKEVSLPVMNRSKVSQPLSEIYTQDMIDKVQVLYARDITEFGYEFEG